MARPYTYFDVQVPVQVPVQPMVHRRAQEEGCWLSEERESCRVEIEPVCSKSFVLAWPVRVC